MDILKISVSYGYLRKSKLKNHQHWVFQNLQRTGGFTKPLSVSLQGLCRFFEFFIYFGGLVPRLGLSNFDLNQLYACLTWSNTP